MSLLSAQVELQISRVKTELSDLEEMKDELEASEYVEMKDEYTKELQKFEAKFNKLKGEDGNLLLDEKTRKMNELTLETQLTSLASKSIENYKSVDINRIRKSLANLIALKSSILKEEYRKQIGELIDSLQKGGGALTADELLLYEEFGKNNLEAFREVEDGGTANLEGIDLKAAVNDNRL